MRILVPLDGSVFSEAALSYALALARSGPYDLTLLSVWEETESGGWHAIQPEAARRMEEQGVRYCETYLSIVVKRLRQEAAVAIDYQVRAGDPATEILLAAESLGANMIVMTTHGRSGITRWRRGSVADKVVHTATIPCLLVGPETAAPLTAPFAIRRILVPLDGSPLSETALRPASDLAVRLGARITLLRAVPRVTPAVTIDFTMVDVAGLDQQAEEAGEAYVNDTQKQLPKDLAVDTVVRRGDAARAIYDYLQEVKVDLVVMASHGRSGFSRWALGSVTEKVLHGRAPVLVIYPETARASVPPLRVPRCHACGRTVPHRDPSSDETCIRCGQHLRTCGNCVFYDGIICLLRRDEINGIIPGNRCQSFQFRETPLPQPTPASRETGR